MGKKISSGKGSNIMTRTYSIYWREKWKNLAVLVIKKLHIEEKKKN